MSSIPAHIVEQVWKKARPENGTQPNLYRKDSYGAWIGKDYYGRNDVEFGWIIEKIDPTGTTDDINNLRAIQWRNKVLKDSGTSVFYVTANGYNNTKVQG